MGATYRKKGRKSWLVTVHAAGQREFKTVHSEHDAKDLVRYIHKQELAGINVIETIRQARQARELAAGSAIEYPRLRDALPTWIARQEKAGEIRGGTPTAYRSRLATWCYPHVLADGSQLGDLRVDEVTREMIGAVIRRVREAGRSLAIVEGIRNPLRGYYAELIETKVFAGPNPAADLRFFIGKQAHRKARQRRVVFFSQEEGPQLVATAKALFPRWHAFILSGLLAGLRWGESAALYKSDVDWRRGRIHVQRTFSEKGNSIQPCKDGEDRWVKASPALLEALRAHIEAVGLDAGLDGCGWTPEQRQLVFPNTQGRITHYG